MMAYYNMHRVIMDDGRVGTFYTQDAQPSDSETVIQAGFLAYVLRYRLDMSQAHLVRHVGYTLQSQIPEDREPKLP